MAVLKSVTGSWRDALSVADDIVISKTRKAKPLIQRSLQHQSRLLRGGFFVPELDRAVWAKDWYNPKPKRNQLSIRVIITGSWKLVGMQLRLHKCNYQTSET